MQNSTENRNPIDYLLEDNFIGYNVNRYAENLSFTFNVGDEPSTDNIWIDQTGQIYIYWPSSFADGRHRWGKLYIRVANKITPAYDACFDEESESYNEKIVNMQRAKYGLELLPPNIIDPMYNRKRNMSDALVGIPI